jgi:Dr1-associated corepressor
VQESESHTGNVRGRGRGRGRGHGRGRGRGRGGGRGAGKEYYMTHEKFDDQSSKAADLKLELADEVSEATEAKTATARSSGRACLRNFDLNLDPADEDEATVPSQTQSIALTNSSAAATAGPSVPQLNEDATTAGLSALQSNEVPKLKDFLGWQLPDMKMSMDPVQYALSSNHTLEEEDYDNEE